MPKQIIKPKRAAAARAERWNDQHRALTHLLEEELHGLVHYLRSLHYVSVFLIAAATTGMIFSLRTLFQNGEHAVTGFLAVLITCSLTIVFSLLALRPWVLPRFLLPIDIRQLRYDEMMDVMRSPREYIHMIKHHIQELTDAYLLRKLRFLRLAIFVFVFGIAVSLILSLALP